VDQCPSDHLISEPTFPQTPVSLASLAGKRLNQERGKQHEGQGLVPCTELEACLSMGVNWSLVPGALELRLARPCRSAVQCSAAQRSAAQRSYLAAYRNRNPPLTVRSPVAVQAKTCQT
jgi:hypothetical protein